MNEESYSKVYQASVCVSRLCIHWIRIFMHISKLSANYEIILASYYKNATDTVIWGYRKWPCMFSTNSGWCWEHERAQHKPTVCPCTHLWISSFVNWNHFILKPLNSFDIILLMICGSQTASIATTMAGCIHGNVHPVGVQRLLWAFTDFYQ